MISAASFADNFNALGAALRKLIKLPPEQRKEDNPNRLGSMYYVCEDRDGKRVALGSKSCIDPRADSTFMSACFLYKDAIRRGVDIKNEDLIKLFRPVVIVPAQSTNLKDHGVL
jgi:hypothetical protein